MPLKLFSGKVLVCQQLFYQLIYDAGRNDHKTSIPVVRNHPSPNYRRLPSEALPETIQLAERVFVCS
jgi:hypothetical protein